MVWEKKLKGLGIGRFQVMALLQAARYYAIYGDKARAKSFGLNRAIFYAWAKHYGSKAPIRLLRIEERLGTSSTKKERSTKCPEGYVLVLGECVKTSVKGYYEIGEQEQTPYDFDKQVILKLKPIVDPDKLWEEAVEYVLAFPRYVLEDPGMFYKYVYEPVRDSFFVKLLSSRKVEPPRELINRLRSLEEVVEKTRKKQRSILDYWRGRDG